MFLEKKLYVGQDFTLLQELLQNQHDMIFHFKKAAFKSKRNRTKKSHKRFPFDEKRLAV